jgi:hypothetical protein
MANKLLIAFIMAACIENVPIWVTLPGDFRPFYSNFPFRSLTPHMRLQHLVFVNSPACLEPINQMYTYMVALRAIANYTLRIVMSIMSCNS